MPNGISYATTCAASRIEPYSAHFEFDAQPAMTTPIVVIDDIARIAKSPRFRFAK
ncbi:hypothetical protein D3C83_178950 [compost metagenome]